MNDIEALQLLIKMRELGITEDQIQSFKKAYKRPEPAEDGEAVAKKLFPEEFTDEEILYYATPYFDELQEQKKVRQQQIKDGKMYE